MIHRTSPTLSADAGGGIGEVIGASIETPRYRTFGDDHRNNAAIQKESSLIAKVGRGKSLRPCRVVGRHVLISN